jgi:DNA-binding IscR family transcriptional regulator
LRVLWRTIQRAVDDVLKRTTLEHLLSSERQMTAWVRTLGAPPGQMSRQ